MTMNNDTYRLNKLQHTKVGDNIDYFVNGVQKSGTVVKMNGGYITVFKDDRYNTIKVDDTFFVKDIIAKQKSWNDMTMGERGEVLVAIKAYSPRYLQKTWEQLPKELQDVIKSGVEQGAYGNVGGRPFMGVSTQFDMDADKDYEGATHTDFSEQFKHEHQKPKVTHEGHDTKKDAMTTADGVNPVANNKKEKRRY